jgi:hypothetical protein
MVCKSEKISEKIPFKGGETTTTTRTRDSPHLLRRSRSLQIPLPPKPLQHLRILPRLPILLPQQLNPLIRKPDPTTHTPAPQALHHPSHDLRIPGVSVVYFSAVPSAAVTVGADVVGDQADVGYYRVEGVGFGGEGEVAALEA